jgi:photosystem II stability/assembly factor-like uncharacterized protein
MKRFRTLLILFSLAIAFAASATLVSSGETAIATTSDTAVTALAADTSQAYLTEVFIINEGTTPGFFSIDGGTTWARLPAGPSSVRIALRQIYQGVKVKRVAGGSNLSGVYVWAD